jgi:hypothetical protein
MVRLGQIHPRDTNISPDVGQWAQMILYLTAVQTNALGYYYLQGPDQPCVEVRFYTSSAIALVPATVEAFAQNLSTSLLWRTTPTSSASALIMPITNLNLLGFMWVSPVTIYLRYRTY